MINSPDMSAFIYSYIDNFKLIFILIQFTVHFWRKLTISIITEHFYNNSQGSSMTNYAFLLLSQLWISVVEYFTMRFDCKTIHIQNNQFTMNFYCKMFCHTFHQWKELFVLFYSKITYIVFYQLLLFWF